MRRRLTRRGAMLLAVVVLTGLSTINLPAKAQAPYIGQLQFFPYNFAPRSWAFCNGQLLPISQNTALFSLLGTTYGGDGRSTFALPNMTGRIPIHVGRGPGLTDRRWGEKGGSETVTLSILQIPNHTHVLNANSGAGNTADPSGAVLARDGRDKTYANSAPTVDMHAGHIQVSGGGQSHDNMPPWLGLNCNIALQGIFPPRS